MHSNIKILLEFLPGYIVTLGLGLGGYGLWTLNKETNPNALVPYLMIIGFCMLGANVLCHILYSVMHYIHSEEIDYVTGLGILWSLVSLFFSCPISMMVCASVYGNLYNFNDGMYLFSLIMIYLLTSVIIFLIVFIFSNMSRSVSFFIITICFLTIIGTSLLIFGYHFAASNVIYPGYAFMALVALFLIIGACVGISKWYNS
jgi:hypothetical protein